MSCPSCGAVGRAGAKFCVWCGARIAPGAPIAAAAAEAAIAEPVVSVAAPAVAEPPAAVVQPVAHPPHNSSGFGWMVGGMVGVGTMGILALKVVSAIRLGTMMSHGGSAVPAGAIGLSVLAFTTYRRLRRVF